MTFDALRGTQNVPTTPGGVLARQSQYVAAAVRQHLARCAAETQHTATSQFLAETELLGSVNSPAAHAVAKRLIINDVIEMLVKVRDRTDCR